MLSLAALLNKDRTDNLHHKENTCDKGNDDKDDKAHKENNILNLEANH